MSSLISYLRWSPDLAGALYFRKHGSIVYAMLSFSQNFQDRLQTNRLTDYFNSL